MNAIVRTLDNVQILTVDTPIWTGTKALEPHEREELVDAEMPDARHWNIGAKSLVFSERLRPMHHVRARIDDLLRASGTRFKVFYACRTTLMPEIVSKLDALKVEYETAVDHFVKNLDIYYEEVIDDLYNNGKAAWAQKVSDAQRQMSKNEVRKRFSFTYFVFSLGQSAFAPVDNEENALDTLFDSVVFDLNAMLRSHIVKMNGLTNSKTGGWKDGYFRSDSRGLYAEVAAKARLFDFLPDGPALVAFADRLETFSLGTGKLEGPEFDALCTMLHGVEDSVELGRRIRELITDPQVRAQKFDQLIAQKLAATPVPLIPHRVRRPQPTVPPVAAQPVAPLAAAPDPAEDAAPSTDAAIVPANPAPLPVVDQATSAQTSVPTVQAEPVVPVAAAPAPAEDAATSTDVATGSTDRAPLAVVDAPVSAPLTLRDILATADEPITPQPKVDPVDPFADFGARSDGAAPAVEPAVQVIPVQSDRAVEAASVATTPFRRERVRRVVPV